MKPPYPFFDDRPPLAIAHRGSRVLWPENTMTAFQGAVDLGCRYLETDLHITLDGVLVTCHDAELDRTTDRSGPIGKITWRELREADAAYHFAPHEGYPLRGKGIGIPSLEEVITEFPQCRLVVDLKDAGLEEAAAEFIRRHDLADRVIVGSFSGRRLAKFRKLTGGAVATSSGPAETLAVWLASRVGRPLRSPAAALQIPREFAFIELSDRKLVQAADAAGKQVHVWTIDDPQEMALLLDRGVHGIVTDRPDLLRRLLEERGEWHQ